MASKTSTTLGDKSHQVAPLLPGMGMAPVPQLKRKGSMDLERQTVLEKLPQPPATPIRKSDATPPPPPIKASSGGAEAERASNRNLFCLGGGVFLTLLTALALALSTSSNNDTASAFNESSMHTQRMSTIEESGFGIDDDEIVVAHPLETLSEEDLDAWRLFYDSLGGTTWNTCASSRDFPCSFEANGCDLALHKTARVICTEEPDVGLKITEIVMRNNNLYGEMPMVALDRLGSYLHVFDVSNHVYDQGHSSSGKNKFLKSQGDSHCMRADWCFENGEFTKCFLNSDVKLCDPLVPLDSPSRRMSKEDMEAWSTLFDQLQGSNWKECSESRNDPCFKCPGRVLCERHFDEMFRIVSLDLSDLIVQPVPFNSKILSRMSALRYLNLSRNALSQSSDAACVNLDFCWANGAICDFKGTGVKVCGDPHESNSETFVMPPQDLVAWKLIYDSLHGSQWKACSDSRENPCIACPDRIKCFTSPKAGTSWISSIDLSFINARGSLPNAPVQQLSNHGLVRLDAHGNGALLLEICPFPACDHLDSKDELEGVHCQFDRVADCPAHDQYATADVHVRSTNTL